MNNAVQQQIDYSEGVGEFRLGQDRVAHREGDRTERAGRSFRIQPKPVLVGLEHCGEGGIEAFIVGLLPLPQLLVVLRSPAAEPERVEEREDSSESRLEDAHREFHTGLECKIAVDGPQLLAGGGDIEYLVHDGVDERLLGAENPKNGALGYPGRLGDLTRADLAAELLQQRLGRRDERCPALVGRKRCCPGHSLSVMSEHSLSKPYLNW